jgi:hypothetical protein
MPFTFSHPAIVLPLVKLGPRWVSFTGLVVGSIIPDFEYFIRMQVKSEFSHTFSGIFWFDLPLAIFITILFHLIVKDSLLQNMPLFLRKRLIKFSTVNWLKYLVSNWTVVLISILIGSFSHIIWDSFTHFHGFFVERIPLLNIGILFIFYHVISLPGTTIETRQVNYLYWIVFSFLIFLIVSMRFTSGLQLWMVGNLIVSIIAAALVSLLFTPFLTKILHKGR